MDITMCDDSYAFDGATPNMRALGGAEKAFVHLAGSLSARGHNVTAITRCEYQSSVDGVLWLPFETPYPPESNVIIAFRKPELLEEFEAQTDHSVLWMWGHPKNLNQPLNQRIIEKHNPTIVFIGDAHSRAWKSWRDFQKAIIVPGVAANYIDMPRPEKIPPPIAIITTHPLHGLQNMLRLWRDRIHPKNEMAELHIYSASLFNGDVVPKLEEIYKEVADSGADKVFVKSPGAEKDMVAVYSSARVHFYPVIAMEFYGSTLAESQATGAPAIIYTGDGDASVIGERIGNGQTGHIAPDDDAFVNLAVQLLAEDTRMYQNLSRDAKAMQASRSWQLAAIEFEALWK
jgi:glycosyltransferase involved in cell wall biosynthesis